MTTNLYGRDLITTAGWSNDELSALMNVAERLRALDGTADLGFFQNELAYAIFFDNSTRTKSAFAGAAARLGMVPVIVDGGSTQVAHGETAEETGAMLGMNAHAMGIRHDLVLGAGTPFIRSVKQGISQWLGDTDDPRQVPMVNLQCDLDHPTQTLADLLWLREKLGGAQGKKIAVSWAYSPSYAKPLSVPQGLISLLPRFGAEVVVAHPEGYDLNPEVLAQASQAAAASGGSLRVTDNMDDAFEGADVVYPKSWGPLGLMTERIAAAGDTAQMADVEQRALAQNAKHTDWICDERRMGLTAGGDALYMHCLPADIGAEVSPGVMAKHRLNVAREAAWKVYVIMAVFAGAKLQDIQGRLAQLEGAR